MANETLLNSISALDRGRNSSARQRLAVIIGVFLLGILLAWRTTTHNPPTEIFRDPLLLAIPAAVGALILLRWPPLGLVGMVFAGLVIPLELGTGTGTKLNAAILLLVGLLGLWAYGAIVRKDRISWMHSRPVAPLIALVVSAIIAFAVGQLPWFNFAQKASLNAQLGGLAIFILAAGAFLLAANQFQNLRWLEWITWAYLALAAVYIFANIAGLKEWSENLFQRGTHTNSIFWLWIVSLAFSQAVFNTRLHVYWRAALGVLLLGAFYLLVGRDLGWTSGWLPSSIAVGVILWVGGSKFTYLAMLAGLGLASTKLDSIQRLFLVGDNEYSLMTRVEAWRIIAEIAKVSPLFGLGPSNYYWYTPLYSILGYYVQFNSHNNYVDLIAQAGLVGLVCFLWFSGELALVGYKLRQLAPEGFARAYVYGALGGLAGTVAAGMFGDWFLPFVYNIGFQGFRATVLGWIFLGGLVAIEQMIRKGTIGAAGE